MIVNLSRDAIHVPYSVGDAGISLATQSAMSGVNALLNSDGVVRDAVAYAQIEHASTYTISTLNKRCAGVLMRAPASDNTPYRVKAYAQTGQGNDVSFGIVLGIAPTSPTGSDDTLTNVDYIPFDGKFDDLIMVPNLDDGDVDYDKAIAFGIYCYSETGISSQHIFGHLSVQRLATRPPTFAQSVS